jgi:hypothetical protein
MFQPYLAYLSVSLAPCSSNEGEIFLAYVMGHERTVSFVNTWGKVIPGVEAIHQEVALSPFPCQTLKTQLPVMKEQSEVL